MPEPAYTEQNGVAIAWLTRASPGEDRPNQDACMLRGVPSGGLILGVADGMGGGPAGDVAAAIALEELDLALDAEDSAGDSRGAILRGLESANERVQAEAPGAGTTVVVAEVDGTTLRSCHIGDSGLLVVSQRGQIKYRTVAHSPVGYALEAGVLDEGDALRHDQLHEVSNALGFSGMRVEISATRELSPYDTVVLATDGILDNLTSEEVGRLVASGGLRAAACALAQACEARMAGSAPAGPSKPDDLTFVLYRPRTRAADRP